MALDLPEDEAITEINVTPLVDVSLVLVIIFMVVAPLFSGILKPLVLPSARAAMTENDSIKVSLFSDGTAAVDAETVPAGALEAALSRDISGGRRPWVVVRADASISHGQVMDAVKAAKKAGAQRVGFAARPKAGEIR